MPRNFPKESKIARNEIQQIEDTEFTRSVGTAIEILVNTSLIDSSILVPKFEISMVRIIHRKKIK